MLAPPNWGMNAPAIAPVFQNNSGPLIRLAGHSYGKLTVRWASSGRGRFNMRRREFITLLGGAAAAWPVMTRAQQPGSIPRIGVLWPGDSPPVSPRMESFRQGLRASGFVDGQNIAIELRYAHRGPQQLPELAAELIRLKVDVIFASGDLAPKVAQQATETIPIVAIGDDILSAGLIASLSRPGGNTTGLTILSPE